MLKEVKLTAIMDYYKFSFYQFHATIMEYKTKEE